MNPKPRNNYVLNQKKRRPVRRKAVTIGVGFRCVDGIVLCSDRQHTLASGAKYEDNKLFSSQRDDYSFIYSFAGDPDAANIMYRRVKEAMPEIVNSKAPFGEEAVEIIGKAFKNSHSKGLQTLIGMKIKHGDPFILKTWDSRVVEGLYECIGFGDSSVLRYLTNSLLPSHLSVNQAIVLGNYLVSVGNRYVDQCSGGPDSMTLHADGNIQETKGGVFPNQKERFSHCEKEIGIALREMLFSGGLRTITTTPIVQKSQPEK